MSTDGHAHKHTRKNTGKHLKTYETLSVKEWFYQLQTSDFHISDVGHIGKVQLKLTKIINPYNSQKCMKHVLNLFTNPPNLHIYNVRVMYETLCDKWNNALI